MKNRRVKIVQVKSFYEMSFLDKVVNYNLVFVFPLDFRNISGLKNGVKWHYDFLNFVKFWQILDSMLRYVKFHA